MSDLYHFSHFLEILSGMYFGGVALLSFMEKGASDDVYVKLSTRLTEAQTAKAKATDFFRVRMSNHKEPGLKMIWSACRWYFNSAILNISNYFFSFSYRRVSAISRNKESKILQKKFLPAFIFSGFLCLAIMLVSAMQVEHINSAKCKLYSDIFMVFYIFSSFLYNIWALIILPKKVSKTDYLHLILYSILICIGLIIITAICERYEIVSNVTAWLIDEKNGMWLITITLVSVTIPLLFIVLASILIFISWEIPVLFNRLIIDRFGGGVAIAEEINNLLP